MSLAVYEVDRRTLTWVGVGNVEGVLWRADATARPVRESLLMRGGVVGYQLPPLRESVLSVAEGDTLVFATDGIRSDFSDGLDLKEPPQQLAAHIFLRCAKDTDDALVLVARFAEATA